MSGECHQSENVLCKHVRATRTFYLDLDQRIPAGVLIDSADASSDDETLTINDVQVVDSDTEITSGDCTVNLVEGRGILVQVSGGTATEDDSETIVTVSWVQDDGDEDAIDCRLLLGGTSGS